MILLDELGPPARFALAYAPKSVRPATAALLALDVRLGQIVARANEPILAQMRLAWWRDRLKEEPEARPKGDRVLEAIGEHWTGREGALIAFVDGWEELLAEGTLDVASIEAFGEAHAAAFESLSNGTLFGADKVNVRERAKLYAWGKLHVRTSDAAERERIAGVALPLAVRAGRLPRSQRPLAILSGLAAYSLRYEGEGLMASRGGILTAWRIALSGR